MSVIYVDFKKAQENKKAKITEDDFIMRLHKERAELATKLVFEFDEECTSIEKQLLEKRIKELDKEILPYLNEKNNWGLLYLDRLYNETHIV